MVYWSHQFNLFPDQGVKGKPGECMFSAKPRIILLYNPWQHANIRPIPPSSVQSSNTRQPYLLACFPSSKHQSLFTSSRLPPPVLRPLPSVPPPSIIFLISPSSAVSPGCLSPFLYRGQPRWLYHPASLPAEAGTPVPPGADMSFFYRYCAAPN